MTQTTNQKLWMAWAVHSARGLSPLSVAGVIGIASLGACCGNRVPRLRWPATMTIDRALALLPALRSMPVEGIHAAAEDAAKAIPSDDLLDMELLISLLQARDLLLDHRDAMAMQLSRARLQPRKTSLAATLLETMAAGSGSP